MTVRGAKFQQSRSYATLRDMVGTYLPSQVATVHGPQCVAQRRDPRGHVGGLGALELPRALVHTHAQLRIFSDHELNIRLRCSLRSSIKLVCVAVGRVGVIQQWVGGAQARLSTGAHAERETKAHRSRGVTHDGGVCQVNAPNVHGLWKFLGRQIVVCEEGGARLFRECTTGSFEQLSRQRAYKESRDAQCIFPSTR